MGRGASSFALGYLQSIWVAGGLAVHSWGKLLALSVMGALITIPGSAGGLDTSKSNLGRESYCGVGCLAIYLNAINISVTLDEVAIRSQKDAVGVSIANLRAAAESFGVNAVVVRASDPKDLLPYGSGAILLLENHGPVSQAVGHFVLMVEGKNGIPFIIDPPSLEKPLNYEDVGSKFSGYALLLSEDHIELEGSIENLNLAILGCLCMVGGFLFAYGPMRGVNTKAITHTSEGNT